MVEPILLQKPVLPGSQVMPTMFFRWLSLAYHRSPEVSGGWLYRQFFLDSLAWLTTEARMACEEE